jgi:hypothetical protein
MRRTPEILPDPRMIKPLKIRFDPSLQAARPSGDQRSPQARQAAGSPLLPWNDMHRICWNHGNGDSGVHLAPLPLSRSEFAARKVAAAVIRLTSPTFPAAKFFRQRLTEFSQP